MCRLFDLDTHRVIVSRDARFINKMFFRCDFHPTALVPHPNDIILNRMHLPPTPQLGKAASATIEGNSDNDSDDDPIESDTDSTVVGTQRGTNADMRGEWQRTIDEELGRNNGLMNQAILQPMGLTVSARRWYGAPYEEPSAEPNVTPAEEEGNITTAERIASLTRLLVMNRAMGYPEYPGLVDIADEFTRFPTEARGTRDHNEPHADEQCDAETIESMPSLEPGEDEEEDDESVRTINSTDDDFPLNLPSDDDADEPDMPLPVTDPMEDEDNDDVLELRTHDAPPSDVEISEEESISILEGVEEAGTDWTTIPGNNIKPHTVTRAGRKCFAPKHLCEEQALVVAPSARRSFQEVNPYLRFSKKCQECQRNLQ